MSAFLEFHSESALLASLRSLLNEPTDTVVNSVTDQLVVDANHARVLAALLGDTGAQQTEQFVELVVAACVAHSSPLALSNVPPERLCAQLDALVQLVVAPPPAVHRVPTRTQLTRVACAVFDVAAHCGAHALPSLRAIAALKLAPVAERWLALAPSAALADVCWRALRQLAPGSAPPFLARVLSTLGAAMHSARAAGDLRATRTHLLILYDLFATPPTLESDVLATWLAALEATRADAEASRAAFDALGELVDSIYAHIVRHAPADLRAATLARLARVAGDGDDARQTVARHALLCECIASPPPSTLDDVVVAEAALDGVALAHAAAQRLGERALLCAPWRRAAFAVSVWLTTTALHARGTLSDQVETLLWRRALAPSLTVAAAAASVWAFALRNGSPEFRRRQVDVLLILMQRGGGDARLDERLAALVPRALPFIDAGDAARLVQCLEQLPRLFVSPLCSTLSVCGASRLRAPLADLPAAYSEPLSRPLELLLQRCAAAPKTVARQADSLLRWCLSGLAGAMSPRNAVLLLDATAALASLPRSAPLSLPQATLEGALRAMLAALAWSTDVQLAVRRLLGAFSAFQLPRPVFEGAFAQLFRAVLAPSQAWPMRAEALLAFQRYAKFAADIGQCQSLLTSESTPMVVAHLNQQLREASAGAIQRELDSRLAVALAVDASPIDSDFASQLHELANLVASGCVEVDATLRASVSAALHRKNKR
jgi:hypothetical protein